MTKQNQKYIMIYRLDFAMELSQRGHKIVQTTPNPQKPALSAFIFEKDETFEDDLQVLLKGGTLQ